jgi:DNA polymerase III epsilon subunit-like protein
MAEEVPTPTASHRPVPVEKKEDPRPSLHFNLQADSSKSTILPRDMANLSLWAVPCTEPLVECPKWAFLEHKFSIRHIVVLYVNHLSYDSLVLGSKLGNLILKPVREGAFIPQKVRQESSLAAAGHVQGTTRQGTVQFAPIWVQNTRNNFAGEFFMRQEARNQQQRERKPEGEASVPVQEAEPKPSHPIADKPPAKPKAGLGSFIQAIVNADREGTAPPNLAEFMQSKGSGEAERKFKSAADSAAESTPRFRWSAKDLQRWDSALKGTDAVRSHNGTPQAKGKDLTGSDVGSTSTAVTLTELVMPVEDMKEHGFEMAALSESWRTFEPRERRPRAKVAVAVDCEMVQTVEGSTLARITVVDCPSGVTLMDSLVKPTLPIVDYVTRYSGITEEMLRDVQTSLADIQNELLDLISTETFVLGHSLENDFKAMKMVPNCRAIDTTHLFPHPAGLPAKNSLRFLVNRYFNRADFQCGSHDSGEDAAVCIELVDLKLRKGKDYGRPKLRNILSLLPVTCSATVFDRTSTVQRLAVNKASNVTAIGCLDDHEVTKRVVKHFWKLHSSAPSAEHSTPPTDPLKSHPEPNLEGGALGTTSASEEIPCTFTWAQLTDHHFHDMSDDTQKNQREAYYEEVKALALHDEAASLRSRAQRKRARQEEVSQPDGQGPPTERPSPSTVEGQAQQVNMRISLMLNAAPDRSLVLVACSSCEEGAPSRLSPAHGACFGFIKESDRYEPVMDNFADLLTTLEAARAKSKEGKVDVCAPS